ncbi:MAG TPA: hypothetical protein VND87_15415 [Stellaceae bacterium]|nr:hypothetical protein [Stellaceae bacterium]
MRTRSGAAALVLVLTLVAAGPVLAGQTAPSADLSATLPPPADRGRPMIFTPPDIAATPGATRCLPALPCGTHLYGAVEKNGAVAIEVPALRW